ncbi:bifunctional (p)ppGpp synthetase/guanosine-3',5'-bis(diphosphate) 3'-pyrophosphohydrolase [bacterium]|nr:bifunctional (p)ppGpp synthetase/guanosine-3',5'-bis(diphosphate) 3'-pyrophosphohydrolase [bacterium]
MQSPLSKFMPQFSGEYPKPFVSLFEKMTLPVNGDRESVKTKVWTAYDFAKHRHEGQKRSSGKPYFEHCLAVGQILAMWGMDHSTIIAGLLHDIIEDTDVTLQDLEQRFGKDIAELVDGVSKLGGIQFSGKQAKQAGNFMKLLLSVAKDLRVIIIKFADRLHNMRTINFLPEEKQIRIAEETKEIYIPLAHRLGMAAVKWELEDLVLKTIHKTEHHEIEKKLKASKKERDKIIQNVILPVKRELNKYNIDANIYGRVKSHSSIFGKMERRGKSFEEIFDIYAIRIIVDKVEECYLALGIIHQIYSPIQDRFKDMIATPKSNGYQSIHTTIIDSKGQLTEIQIRTREMEQTAEIGVAAHWRYKEEHAMAPDLDSNVKWLRELVNILKDESSDPAEFMNLLKIDMFDDEIFVFTPKGDLEKLPVNATPIDFAFQIHSEVGLHCLGCKINHKIFPLNTKLKNGDIVEIITSATQEPSYGWLKLVVTSKARNFINRHLRAIHSETGIKIGKDILEKTLRRLKRKNDLEEIKESFAKFGLDSLDQLYESIGNGTILVRDIFKKLKPKEKISLEEDEEEDQARFIDFARSSSKGIKLQGIKDLMVSFGKCCNPIPGDEMVGFITRGRGLTVHRTNCSSLPILNEESDRLMPVEWDVSKKELFSARIKVISQDSPGILKKISECISSLNINISSVDLKVMDNFSTAYFIVKVNNVIQLDRMMKKLIAIKEIDFVERTDK